MASQYSPRRSENYDNVKPRKKLRRTAIDRFGTVAMLLLLLASAFLAYQLIKSQMLESIWLYVLIGVLSLLNVIQMIVQLPLRRNKLGKFIFGFIAIVLSTGMLYASIATGSVQNAISKISGMLTQKEVTSVIVMADDPAQTIEDAGDYTFGYLKDTADDIMQDLYQQTKQQLGHEIRTSSFSSPVELAEALYSGEVGAILLHRGYTSVLEKNDKFKTFSTDTRVLCEYTTERQIIKDGNNQKLDVSKPFVVYCSGIDARQSDINAKSLSDVNILAAVNPQTHEIVLINTPRDYFVPLHFNGAMDKLTHAGIYGIDESMAVLSDLYGVDINYYVRVNFNGLVDIVDAMDGIDVDSEYEFTTRKMVIPDETGEDFYWDSFSFNEGVNHLNGRQALAFSRERYSFALGDIQRGKNQMAVIKAIVSKATSPSVLANYNDLLHAVSDAFITNFTYDDIAALVKMQEKDMTGWHISTFSVSGENGAEETYTGGYAYVMYQDPDLIAEAKEMLAKVVSPE